MVFGNVCFVRLTVDTESNFRFLSSVLAVKPCFMYVCQCGQFKVQFTALNHLQIFTVSIAVFFMI